jgi:hypothetical protein
MYADEVYTLGHLIVIGALTFSMGWMLASERYQRKMDKERAIRDRYKWALMKERGEK